MFGRIAAATAAMTAGVALYTAPIQAAGPSDAVCLIEVPAFMTEAAEMIKWTRDNAEIKKCKPGMVLYAEKIKYVPVFTAFFCRFDQQIVATGTVVACSFAGFERSKDI